MMPRGAKRFVVLAMAAGLAVAAVAVAVVLLVLSGEESSDGYASIGEPQTRGGVTVTLKDAVLASSETIMEFTVGRCRTSRWG